MRRTEERGGRSAAVARGRATFASEGLDEGDGRRCRRQDRTGIGGGRDHPGLTVKRASGQHLDPRAGRPRVAAGVRILDRGRRMPVFATALAFGEQGQGTH
jgi:hypothetical protein